MQTLDQLRNGQLAGAQRLNLQGGLTEFPAAIFELAESLEILDLSNNQLSTLPDELPRLHQLRVLFLNHNAFETVPSVLAQCPSLTMIGFKANRLTSLPDNALPPQTRWLILTDNQLETLPPSLGTLKHLQKLMLAGNRLRSLPDTMANCRHLELVRLAANQLPSLPTWLGALPRLAWLAYGGNPLHTSGTAAPQTPLPTIDWADLVSGVCLGQGASGVITQGLWKTPTGAIEVAIKLFKGAITSDGYPADEMRASLAAGRQPNLVSPIGQIANHPEQKQGLVFPLVPPSFRSLGNPPSLESCTRDTYPPGSRFPLAMTLKIAKGVAAAAAHLHRQGLMHGDLYAHNTLVNEAGTALLGDFGAASFYPSPGLGLTLERIEVRAFGCLLEDLLDRTPLAIAPQAVALIQALRGLQHDCLQSIPSRRPRFEDILQRLQALQSQGWAE